MLNYLLTIISLALFMPKTASTTYIEQHAADAIAVMAEHGIPASITLAQGIIESGNGTSRLARECNNHFGLKCFRPDCQCATRKPGESDGHYRCFASYLDCLETRSRLLKHSSRYRHLFSFGNDYRRWAHGLKKAGYATSNDYDKTLISTIEASQLQRYDTKD